MCFVVSPKSAIQSSFLVGQIHSFLLFQCPMPAASQEERRKAEAEAKRKAEAEAKRKAEAEAKAQQKPRTFIQVSEICHFTQMIYPLVI